MNMVQPNTSEHHRALALVHHVLDLRARLSAARAAHLRHSAHELERKLADAESRVRHMARAALDGMP